MKKSVIITVMLDGVSYSEIEDIETGIKQVIEEVEQKRVTINVQDTPLLPSLTFPQ